MKCNKTLLALPLALTFLFPPSSSGMALKNMFGAVDPATTNFIQTLNNSNTTPEKEVNKLTNPPSFSSGANCEAAVGGSNSTEQFNGTVYTPPKKEERFNFPFDIDDGDKDLYINYSKLGGDPIALKQALCFQRKFSGTKFKAKGDGSHSNGISIKGQRYITINDLNKRSDGARMFVLDTETGKVQVYFSAHGIGGKAGAGENNPFQAEYYSNVSGSLATPRGFFITGASYNGKYGLSMRMHGLQERINDNSFLRAVVMHGYEGMNPSMASSDDEDPKKAINAYGDVATSWGCTMLEPERAHEVINTIKEKGNGGGSLYYNYTQEEKALGQDYCGETNLMIKK